MCYKLNLQNDLLLLAYPNPVDICSTGVTLFVLTVLTVPLEINYLRMFWADLNQILGLV